MKLKKMLTLAATFVATLSLAACSASSSSDSSQSTLEKIKEKGTLVVATSPDYAPLSFKPLLMARMKSLVQILCLHKRLLMNWELNLKFQQ